jgi:hypothetical protein
LREYSSKRGVIQQYISNPLLVFGQPLNLRIYVVVTSIAPLRAYVHNEGLVFHRYEEDKNFKRVYYILNNLLNLIQSINFELLIVIRFQVEPGL